MVKSNRKFMVVGLVAVAALMMGASQADAFWGCGWGGCGYAYSPCWTSCYAPCYTSCYTPACVSTCDPYCGNSWYLGYRPGPVRRWLLGPYRWYYAGGAGCYWGACYTGCYTDCCTDAVSCCEDGVETSAPAAAPSQPTPAPKKAETPAAPAPAPAAPAPAPAPAAAPQPTTSLPTGATSGLLTIWVPVNAKVFINGAETTTQGSRRRYVSHGLQPGLTYKYDVRVELVRNGKMAEESKTVYLTAGSSEGLAFGFNREPISNLAAAQ